MAITTSSVSTYKEFENKRQEQRDNAILNIGIGSAGVFGTSKLLATDTGQSVASKIFKLNTVDSYFTYGATGLVPVKYNDLKIKNKITLGDIALDFSKTLEEISPLKILRTFHVSSFISPYTIPKSNIKPMYVTADDLMLDEQYFRKLFTSRGNNVSQTTMNDLFNKGAMFENGQLKTMSGDLVLDNARLVKLAPSPLDEQGRSTHPFLNRVYEKFRNIIGETDDSGFFRAAMSPRGGIGIIGGKSEATMARDWARSYGRLALEPGFKLFDRPLDVLAEVVDRTGLPEKYNMATSLRDTLYLGAGAGGDYTQSVPKMFATMGKRVAALTVAGALAYNFGDAAVRDIASEDSAYKKGIIAGVATGYTEARVGFAEMWSDRFQDYKANQEHLAEGSTSLLTLAGFPLAGALFGANVGYSMRLKDAATKGVAAADVIAHTEGQGKLLNTMLGKGSTNGPSLNRVGRFAAIGALIGLIPVLPFLPGALIGESSEDLRKIYSGEEDVAIKSTRFWGSGGKEWSGGKIKYFTKSWYSQLMNNAEDAGKYDNQETKDELNPVLHPFDYLRNPYRLEELNQDRSPYAVWGMEVSYGGAFGKLYQGTIGALIKPDVVNERLDDYIEGGSINSSGGVELKQQVSDTEKQLIDEGLMLAPEAAKLTTDTELVHTAYSALTDFAGLKGWVGSLASDAVHTGLGDPGLQLDRSGAMNNSARSLVESNLGGMGPVGESLRRFIPTNAGSILDRANPLRNQMPEWMPHDVNNYWIDFSSGDPYAKVEKGYFRLPGQGFEELHPELKGVDPNDYADIYKYKILSDVAMGSDEYYRYKDMMDARAANDQLTDYEKQIYAATTQQINDRSVHKEFYNPLTDSESAKAGLLGSALSSFWDAATGAAELPTESLTFLRPGAKLIHKRTALEDYYATQVDGTDTGMWTKPYDHFIKPAINKTLMTDTGVPEETVEKRSVNEYFDKLQYVKYRNLYKQALKDGDGGLAYDYKKKYQTTITGALASGLDENMEVTRGYIALPDQEKAYFAAFSGATSEQDRQSIVNAESTSVAELYSKIWQRRDAIANNADDPDAQASAIRNIVQKDEQSLAVSNPGLYASYKVSSESKTSSFSEYVADKEAESYINNTTGMPDKSFSGWDPRIDINDIKLKTLSVGKEDVRGYGFWQDDEARLARLVAVDKENQVVNDIDRIKMGIREEKSRAAAIKADLYKRGINVDSVQFHKSKTEDINMTIGA